MTQDRACAVTFLPGETFRPRLATCFSCALPKYPTLNHYLAFPVYLSSDSSPSLLKTAPPTAPPPTRCEPEHTRVKCNYTGSPLRKIMTLPAASRHPTGFQSMVPLDTCCCSSCLTRFRWTHEVFPHRLRRSRHCRKQRRENKNIIVKTQGIHLCDDGHKVSHTFCRRCMVEIIFYSVIFIICVLYNR